MLQVAEEPPAPKSNDIDIGTGEAKRRAPARLITAGDDAVDDRQAALMHRFEAFTLKLKFIRKRRGLFCCVCHTLTMVEP